MTGATGARYVIWPAPTAHTTHAEAIDEEADVKGLRNWRIAKDLRQSDSSGACLKTHDKRARMLDGRAEDVVGSGLDIGHIARGADRSQRAAQHERTRPLRSPTNLGPFRSLRDPNGQLDQRHGFVGGAARQCCDCQPVGPASYAVGPPLARPWTETTRCGGSDDASQVPSLCRSRS